MFKKIILLTFLVFKTVNAAAEMSENTLECPLGIKEIVAALYHCVPEGKVKTDLLTYWNSTTPMRGYLSSLVSCLTFVLPTYAETLNPECSIFNKRFVVLPLDYSDASACAQAINKIVGERTDEQITSIVTPSDFNEPLMFTLLHVMHLDTRWKVRFEEESVRFNIRSTAKTKYCNGFGLDLTTQIPYLETENAMIVLLKANGNLRLYLRLDREEEKVEAISSDELTALNSSMDNERPSLHILIPNFKIESKIDLLKTLDCLPKGEFDVDLFTPPQKTMLGKCFQQNILDVSIYGMKASSVTFGACGYLCVKRYGEKKALFNRPFSYAVADGENVLFTGAVYDPA